MPRWNRQEKALLIEGLRRDTAMNVTERKPVARTELGFDRHLNDWQHQVIHDPSKRIHLCMGRRSGKSMVCIVLALRMSLSREGALTYCIYPSRDRAKSTLWSFFKNISDVYRLGATFHENDLTITFKTGSVIRLLGTPDSYFADRLRGVPGDLYIVDECQSFRDKVLKYLIEECVEPAGVDMDAPVILCGTPSNHRTGYWFESDIRNSPDTQFSCYNATILENAYHNRWRGLPGWQEKAEQFLVDYRAKKGWSESNPTYRREWLNLWETDNESFYYSEFKASRNTIDPQDIPSDLSFVIGGDFGSRVDPTALVVLGYNPSCDDVCYVVECVKIESPTQAEHICARLKRLIDEYEPEAVVGDYASGGTYLFDQMHERYNVYIEDAEKKKKSGQTDVINSEFHEGRIKLSADLTDLVHELQTVHWDDDRKGPLPSDSNDCCDAFQYGYAHIFNYLFKPKQQPKSRQDLLNEELEQFFAREDAKIQQSTLDDEVWGIRMPT